MTPWTGLLESLHSSLIDEINARKPKLKPELGLPIRKTAWGVPDPTVTRAALSEVGFGASTPRGAALLTLEEAGEKFMGASLTEIWTACLGRAAGEFTRRGIAPELLKARVLPLAKLAELQYSRLIWIPFKFGGHACYLGIGVAESLVVTGRN